MEDIEHDFTILVRASFADFIVSAWRASNKNALRLHFPQNQRQHGCRYTLCILNKSFYVQSEWQRRRKKKRIYKIEAAAEST